LHGPGCPEVDTSLSFVQGLTLLLFNDLDLTHVHFRINKVRNHVADHVKVYNWLEDHKRIFGSAQPPNVEAS
jgi:hypothetical protein